MSWDWITSPEVIGGAISLGSALIGSLGGEEGQSESEVQKSGTSRTTYGYDDRYGVSLAHTGEVGKRMAADAWELYNDYFRDYEIDAVKSNKELLPYISDYSKAAYEELTQTSKEFHRQAREGIDVSGRMEEAEAGVVGAFDKVPGELRRERAKYGIDPSGRGSDAEARTLGIEKAKAIAGARIDAKNRAEAENFSRVALASGREPSRTGLVGTPDMVERSRAGLGYAQNAYGPLANRILSRSTKTAGAQSGQYEDKSNIWDAVGDVGGMIGGGSVSGWGTAGTTGAAGAARRGSGFGVAGRTASEIAGGGIAGTAVGMMGMGMAGDRGAGDRGGGGATSGRK